MSNLPAVPEGVSLSTSGLTLPADLSEADWAIVGCLIARSEESLSWVKADWWAYGSAREFHSLAETAALLGWAPQTLKNAAVVARAFPQERRHLELTFTHHAEAAAAAPAEQDAVLQAAVQEGLSPREVRRRLRGLPEAERDAGLEGGGPTPAPARPSAGDVRSSWGQNETLEERAIEQLRQAAVLIEDAVDLVTRGEFRLTPPVGADLLKHILSLDASRTLILDAVRDEVGSLIEVPE